MIRPLKITKRHPTDSSSSSSSPIKGTPRRESQSFAGLQTRSLVSNSIFFKLDENSSPTPSTPTREPRKRQASNDDSEDVLTYDSSPPPTTSTPKRVLSDRSQNTPEGPLKLIKSKDDFSPVVQKALNSLESKLTRKPDEIDAKRVRFEKPMAQEKTTIKVSVPATASGKETPVVEAKAQEKTTISASAPAKASENGRQIVEAKAQEKFTTTVATLATSSDTTPRKEYAPKEPLSASTIHAPEGPLTAGDIHAPEETLSTGAIYAHKQMVKDTGCHRWWDPMHVHRDDWTPDLVKNAMSDNSYEQVNSSDIQRTEYPNLDKGRFVDYSFYCPAEDGMEGELFFTGGEDSRIDQSPAEQGLTGMLHFTGDEDEEQVVGTPHLRSPEVSFYTAKSPESPEASFSKDLVRSDGRFAELSSSLKQSIGEDLGEVMRRHSTAIAIEAQQGEGEAEVDEVDDFDDFDEEIAGFEAEHEPQTQKAQAEQPSVKAEDVPQIQSAEAEQLSYKAQEVQEAKALAEQPSERVKEVQQAETSFQAKHVPQTLEETSEKLEDVQEVEASVEQPSERVEDVQIAEASVEVESDESGEEEQERNGSPQRYSHAEKTSSLLDTPVHQPFAKEVDHELKRILDGGDFRHILSQKSHEIPFADYLEFEPDDTLEIEKWAFELGLECRSFNRKKSNIDKWVENVVIEKEPEPNGKLFVKVLKLENIDLPVPPEAVYFTCTVDNGIHEVTTEWLPFNRNAEINQEFVFMANQGLEFTLTLKFRIDTKLDSPEVQRQKPRTGLSRILHSPRKVAGPKHSEKYVSLMRSAGQDGSFAKSYVAFDQVSDRCDSQVFTVSYPCLNEWQMSNSPLQVRKGTTATQQPNVVGSILMQMMYAPRTDGLKAPDLDPSEYPKSLSGCIVALRVAEWHKKKWYEGPMAQLGGGTTYWKRRHFELIGGKLIARNEITKKLVEVMDLSRAIYLSDDKNIPIERGARKVSDQQRKRKAERTNQPPPTPMLPPASSSSKRFQKNLRLMTEANRRAAEQDEDTFYPVERSFRIVFKDGMVASFYTDTEEQRQDWLKVLGALIGKVPPNNMWAARVLRKRDLQGGDKSRNVSDRTARVGYESRLTLGPSEEEIGSRQFKPSTRVKTRTGDDDTVLYGSASISGSEQGPAGPANAARRK